MFSCLQINCQPFYLRQLLKFHQFDWLIEIYLQTEDQGTHHKMVSVQPMSGFSPLFVIQCFVNFYFENYEAFRSLIKNDRYLGNDESVNPHHQYSAPVFPSPSWTTAQGIKLKLSDFKNTPSRHILQVKPVRHNLSCYHGNKITEGTSQDLATKKSEKSAICEDIELKFGIETKFGPLGSKTNLNLQFDVIMTSW